MPSFSRWNWLDLPFICSFPYYIGILDQIEHHTQQSQTGSGSSSLSFFQGAVVFSQVQTVYTCEGEEKGPTEEHLLITCNQTYVWNSGWFPWRWFDSDSRQLRFQTEVMCSSSCVLPLQSPINKVSLSGPLMTSLWEGPDTLECLWLHQKIANVTKFISLSRSPSELGSAYARVCV